MVRRVQIAEPLWSAEMTFDAMTSGLGSPVADGLGHCPSPLQREWVRPARSHQVGPEIKVMGPSEDVWRRLPLPGTVVTWRVTGSWEEGDRVGRANLARFQVDRCSDSLVLRTGHSRALHGLVLPRRRLLSGGRVDGQTRCLGRVEQALVVSHERGQ